MLWRVMALVLTLSACSAENPDEALRALIADMETAAESRDTGFFRGVVADSYRDARGNDRDRIIDLVRAFFLTNSSIEAVVRVDDVSLDGSDSADVELQLALLSSASGRSLLGLDGQLRRVDLEFLRIDGDWMLIGADWRPIVE